MHVSKPTGLSLWNWGDCVGAGSLTVTSVPWGWGVGSRAAVGGGSGGI